MKTCVIYLRVSSAAQAEKELPIESQLEQCEKKAAELDTRVLKVFSDEGVSGRTDVRPHFQAALSYCESFSVDYFICWSTSRFARNSLDAQLNKRHLVSCGTKVVYVSVSIDEGSSGYLHERILEIFDEHTSRQISSDTLRSMLKNARDGFFNGGRPPYGYKVLPSQRDPKKKELVPDDYESAIVVRMFELRVKGLGSRGIADEFNKKGLKNRGKHWSKTTVASLLKNERLVGRAIFGQSSGKVKQPREKWVIVENAYRKVVDLDIFNRVQALIEMDTPLDHDSSPKSTWFFTGMLKCGRCNRSMQIESAKGRSQRYYYYNCSSNQKRGECSTRRIRADILDAWLSEVIMHKIFSPSNIGQVLADMEEMYSDWSRNSKSERSTLSRRLSDLETKNSHLYSLLEDPSCEINLGDLSPRLRQNNKEITEIRRNIEVIDKQNPSQMSFDSAVVDDVIDFLKAKLRNADNPISTRAFYKTFIESVSIGDDEVKIEYRAESLLKTGTIPVPSSEDWLLELGSNQRPTD